jgi:YidC/Oxa1 family membrane protein insertase
VNRDTVKFLVSSGILFAAFFGYQYYMATNAVNIPGNGEVPKRSPASEVSPAVPALSPVASSTPAPATADTTAPSTPLSPPRVLDPSELVLDNGRLEINFVQQGGCLGATLLKEHKVSLKEATPAHLYDTYLPCKGFGFRIDGKDLRKEIATIERVSPQEFKITQQSADLEITRRFRFENSSYYGVMTLEFANKSPNQIQPQIGFELGAISNFNKGGSWFTGSQHEFKEAIYKSGDEAKRESLPFEEAPSFTTLTQERNVPLDWAAAGSLYFVSAALPKFKDPLSFSVVRTGENVQKNRASVADLTLYEAWVDQNLTLAPNEKKTFEYDLYLGPKQKAELEKFKERELDQVIDYGFFKVIAWPIFYGLRALHGLTGNWGIAIILLTIALKMIFYPLTVKSYLAGKKMQKLQPLMNEVKEKYKDDKQRQQQEMMALMAKQGANPLAGCLPILPQMPVFFALWAMLQQTFDLRQAPFFLWIHDLSSPDPYYISPVIMAALQFLQQKLTPVPSMDPAQAKMMQFIPIIFALFMISTPSGLVLYIITNSTITLLQQQYMMRKHKEA